MADNPIDKMREESPSLDPTVKITDVKSGITLRVTATTESMAKTRADRWLVRNSVFDVNSTLSRDSVTQESGLVNTYYITYS